MERTFNSLLFDSVDDVLSSLGEPVKNQVYVRLEEDFSIQKDQIPEQIRLFSEFLIRTFGPTACLIQIKIMKSFNAKLSKEIVGNVPPITLSDDFSFVSYIQQMRNSKNLPNMQP